MMWPFNAKPDPSPLELVFVPSLVSILLHHEKQKGAPLTEAEVVAIRDKAVVIALPLHESKRMTEARGYADIKAQNCWQEWLAARATLDRDETP